MGKLQTDEFLIDKENMICFQYYKDFYFKNLGRRLIYSIMLFFLMISIIETISIEKLLMGLALVFYFLYYFIHLLISESKHYCYKIEIIKNNVIFSFLSPLYQKKHKQFNLKMLSFNIQEEDFKLVKTKTITFYLNGKEAVVIKNSPNYWSIFELDNLYKFLKNESE